jgi:ribosomal protein S18 acetylase RimI-like enzyme
VTRTGSVRTRPYRTSDADALWACKRGFETALGEGTGDDDKTARYADKLTSTYRRGYLDWVARCVETDPGCLRVAEHVGGTDVDRPAGSDAATAPDDPGTGADTPTPHDADGEAGKLVGYAFVLPERLGYVWDAAVLNELYVAPAFRGTGLSDDLLEAAIDHARGQSVPLDRIVLDVDPANAPAKRLYDRHGFEQWGQLWARAL